VSADDLKALLHPACKCIWHPSASCSPDNKRGKALLHPTYTTVSRQLQSSSSYNPFKSWHQRRQLQCRCACIARFPLFRATRQCLWRSLARRCCTSLESHTLSMCAALRCLLPMCPPGGHACGRVWQSAAAPNLYNCYLQCRCACIAPFPLSRVTWPCLCRVLARHCCSVTAPII
jgi:hypothetical protein